MTTLLEARGVRKVFAGGDGQPLDVLRGLDLEVRRGEVVAVVGASYWKSIPSRPPRSVTCMRPCARCSSVAASQKHRSRIAPPASRSVTPIVSKPTP